MLAALAAAAQLAAFGAPISEPPPPPAPSDNPAPPRPSIITNPDWLSKPGPYDFSLLYPAGAALAKVGSRVVIACRVDAQGYLRDCTVVSDSLPGWGFGDAALKMAERFRMRPATRDGQPVDARTVRIPLNFSAPEDEAPPEPGLEEAAVCYGVTALYAQKMPAERWAVANATYFANLIGMAMATDGKSTPVDFERRLALERAKAAKLSAAAQREKRDACSVKLQDGVRYW